MHQLVCVVTLKVFWNLVSKCDARTSLREVCHTFCSDVRGRPTALDVAGTSQDHAGRPRASRDLGMGRPGASRDRGTSQDPSGTPPLDVPGHVVERWLLEYSPFVYPYGWREHGDWQELSAEDERRRPPPWTVVIIIQLNDEILPMVFGGGGKFGMPFAARLC